MLFHPLDISIAPPERMSNPFSYQPHPLCIEAARRLQAQIGSLMARHPDEGGKMFGVLVVSRGSQLGYLQAYSGQLGGAYPCTDEYVPPVFDYLSPQGHFKQTEQRISQINQQIDRMEHDPMNTRRQQATSCIAQAGEHIVAQWRQHMADSKRRRDLLRATADGNAIQAMVRESQYQKAQLRRLRSRWQAIDQALCRRTDEWLHQTDLLRRQRRQMSDQLQRWLFDHFMMRNARGEERSLSDIFAHYDASRPYLVPPGGTGECCEPKLLQYAYLHGMRPRCMAMFWWGASPEGEVRHHLHYYPACQGKCRPTLSWMLQGLDIDDPLPAQPHAGIEVVYEDAWIAVVCKPSGMLSVPGRSGLPSVASWARQHYPQVTGPMMVHRLDRDTSGLMVIALTTDAYHQLQQQFARHLVHKTYVAVLEDGPMPQTASGRIDLPLSAHPTDSPRQQADRLHGREAVTHYQMDGRQRVTLSPVTGRTHQLRLHCAHPEGLGRPILGDPLYGHGGPRLHLHAQEIRFTHPVTGQQMVLCRPADF